jgi:hypothetical protein
LRGWAVQSGFSGFRFEYAVPAREARGRERSAEPLCLVKRQHPGEQPSAPPSSRSQSVVCASSDLNVQYPLEQDGGLRVIGERAYECLFNSIIIVQVRGEVVAEQSYVCAQEQTGCGKRRKILSPPASRIEAILLEPSSSNRIDRDSISSKKSEYTKGQVSAYPSRASFAISVWTDLGGLSSQRARSNGAIDLGDYREKAVGRRVRLKGPAAVCSMV